MVRKLGPEYRLDGILDLEKLGLTDWPYSVAGKLSITELKERLAAWMCNEMVAPSAEILASR